MSCRRRRAESAAEALRRKQIVDTIWRAAMEWDPAKRLSNLRKHGMDFRDAAEFDFDSARLKLDLDSEPYEEREVATGFFRNKICVLVYTRRRGVIRVISFREAKRKEANDYVENLDRGT